MLALVGVSVNETGENGVALILRPKLPVMFVADLAPAVPSALRSTVTGVTIKITQGLPVAATRANLALHFIFDDDCHDLAFLVRHNPSHRVSRYRLCNAIRQPFMSRPRNTVA